MERFEALLDAKLTNLETLPTLLLVSLCARWEREESSATEAVSMVETLMASSLSESPPVITLRVSFLPKVFAPLP